MATNAMAVVALCADYLPGHAVTFAVDGAGAAVFTFTPPLSAAEQTTFDDLQTMARFGVSLSLTEWQSIKSDAAGLRTYLGVASPTAAQTASATKAIIRVLATIIRS